MGGQVRSQLDAVLILQQAFGDLQRHLERLDKVARLDNIRDIVKREVQDIRRTETAAHCAEMEGRLVGGLAGFGIATLLAAMRNMEDPFLTGARAVRKRLTDDLPFGKVMVSVGPGEAFQRVEVIPVSKRARELRCSESDIIGSMLAQGRNLVTPEAFFDMIEKLKEQVITGADGSP